MSSIDLGREMPDYMAGPSPAEKSEKTRLYYPSTCIDTNKDLALPDEGEITFKYKLNRDSTNHNRRDPESQKKFSYEMDLLTVESVKATGAKTATDEGGVALDKLKAEVEDDEDDEDDDNE